jgi:uncharacterized membrane protein
MAFCNKCGKQNNAGEAFCNGCGTPIATDGGQQAQQNTADSQQKSGNFFTGAMNTPETQYDSADVEANKILSLFAYWGLLFLIPLLGAPNSPYAKFHANQGVVLLISEVALGVVVGILIGIITVIAAAIGGVVGGLFALFSGLLYLVLAAYSLGMTILGIVNAVSGKAKELPIIGKFRIIK